MSGPTPHDLGQPVLAPPARVAIFATVTIRDGHEEQVRAALAQVPSLKRSVGFREPELGLSCVVGIGSRLWDRTYPDLPRPEHLHPFVPLVGPAHSAPSTPGDLLFHLRAQRPDLCFELARQLRLALGDAVESTDEVHGFRYFDERDLLGFVDGTENPEAPVADVAAALVADGPYAGASYVIVQKYLHDLSAWAAIGTAEQERVIGRTKLEDIQLPDDELPTNSHVALNTIEEPDGTQRQIVRDNLPFGNVGDDEFGTYFIGYAADPDVTEEMLRRMFLGEPAGNYDRILDFSVAHTGCLFFVPPAGLLEDPQSYAPDTARDTAPDTARDTARDTAPDTASGSGSTDNDQTPADGSLGIGSLRRSDTT